MAKIAGFELKAVKSFKDHDGYTIYQGNVYFKGKKLGFWSQDGWGGPDRYEFDERPYNEALVKVTVEDYPVLTHCFELGLTPNMDILMGELIELKDTEKQYKAALKKGYTKVAVLEGGYAAVFVGMKESENALSDGIMAAAAKQLRCKVEDITVGIYDKDSFVVGEALSV